MARFNAIFVRSKRLLNSKSMLTVLDQVVVSGVNFLIGIFFIYFSTPYDYGIYTVYMSLFFLLTNVQNSLINTPTIVLTPRMKDFESKEFRNGMFAILLVFLFLAFIVIAVFSYFEGNFTRLGTLIVGLSLSLLLMRDYFRAEEFSQLTPDLALKRDIIYFTLSIFGLLILLYYYSISTLSVFIVIGVSALIIVSKKTMRFFKSLPTWKVVRSTLTKSWTHSRWSLVGATSSWAQGNAYIYIPFFLLGTKEIAFIAASRLLMTPIPLLIGSFSNVMRPLLSKNISNGKGQQSLKIVRNFTLLLTSILIIYTAIIITILNLIPMEFLPSEYLGLESFVLIWFTFYLLRIVKSSVSNYMQASLSFKPLAFMGISSTVITVISTILSIILIGIEGSLIGMILGELFLIILMMYWLKTFKKEEGKNE